MLVAPALPSVPASAAGRESVRATDAETFVLPRPWHRAPWSHRVASVTASDRPQRARRGCGRRERAAHAQERSSRRSLRAALEVATRCSVLAAARNAWSYAATPQALWNPRAHGGDNALDLPREVPAARRPEDLSETWRQAPAHIQPDADVTLLCR